MALLFSACGLIEEESDCSPIVDLREDILTMNPTGAVGLGSECKFAYIGGPNVAEFSFYSSLETDRTFEWELPTGMTSPLGEPLGTSVTTTEPFVQFVATDQTPQFNRIGMRITNPCSESNWVYDSLEILDVAVPTISSVAELPEGRAYAATAVLDGEIYVLYGANYDNALEYRFENYKYNPAADEWTILPAPTLPTAPRVGLNIGASVQVGDDVYMLDQFMGVYRHNLRTNELTMVADSEGVNPGGDVSVQGAQIQFSRGELIIGPANEALWTLDLDTKEWIFKAAFRYVDNVNKVDHSWSANNRIYYAVHEGPLVEYNTALGEFRAVIPGIQHVGYSFVVNNQTFVQHSENGDRLGKIQALDYNELTFEDYPIVAGNACTAYLGEDNFYMVSTAVIGKSAYMIGGGRIHDGNGRGGYGSSTLVRKIFVP
ncbi:MAG: hypothetical protein AB8F78_18445 [Saprospiraceae bacterium]